METTPWVIDEEPHRAVLPEMRMWMEDELHQFSIGRFAAGSKRHRRLVLLAQAHDQYHTLFFKHVVNGELIDSIARGANRKLLAENEQLVLKNKLLTVENEQLKIDARFFHKEAVYYKLTLEQEGSTAKKFFSWALDYIIIRMKGGTSS